MRRGTLALSAHGYRKEELQMEAWGEVSVQLAGYKCIELFTVHTV
jgi:hypothetical protein